VDGSFRTNDGVTLRYTTAGAGRAVVFVHGWQQDSRQWQPAVARLTGCLRVTYDHRGHGRSEDSVSGWTTHRLAVDLWELLAALELTDVTLVGHSMGCSVIWAYLELFGSADVRGLVFVDQSPVMVTGPFWDADAALDAGAMFTGDQLTEVVHGLRSPQRRADIVRQLVSTMVSDSFPGDQLDETVEWNLRVDGEFASALLADHASHDWRPPVSGIKLPTLVVAGSASAMPWRGSHWIADRIHGSMFELVEGGSHLLMVEMPGEAAGLLAKFLELTA
jgi:pimeloyl-ACP methyl ester carboxylesterase